MLGYASTLYQRDIFPRRLGKCWVMLRLKAFDMHEWDFHVEKRPAPFDHSRL